MKKTIFIKIFAMMLLYVAFGTGLDIYASGFYYETKSTSIITDGVKKDSVTRIYPRGIVNIEVLHIDVKNPNVRLGVLESKTELGLKESVEKMANDAKAVAAINADFFVAGNPQSSVGVTVNEGKVQSIIEGLNNKNLRFAGLYLDDTYTPFIEFIKNQGLKITGGISLDIRAKNKYTSLTKPIYIDHTAMATTESVDKRNTSLVKIVVDDGVVTYVSKKGETVDVPQNGYVILLDPNATAFYAGRDLVGLTAEFTENNTFVINTDRNIENVLFGIGGGGLILQNGALVSNKGDIIEANKRHPRTVAGITKDAQKIILVVIDGRGVSLGATHVETAEILLSYGVHNAMYFDGGGSSTLVARNPGENSATLQNDVSEGTQRKVSNALGVFTISPAGYLNNVDAKVKNSSDNVAFVNNPIRFDVNGYDQYRNPYDISNEQIDISISGVNGTWKDNLFYPSQTGKATASVTVKGIQYDFTITVLSEPSGFEITPHTAVLGIGESKTFSVSTKNSDGFGVPLDKSKIVWRVDSDSATVDTNGKLTAVKRGKVVVTATIDGNKVSAEVGIGGDDVILTSYEKDDNITFIQYPEHVKGSVSFTTAEKYDKTRSLALKYNFAPNSAETQAAYIDFSKAATKTYSGSPIGIAMLVKGDASGNMLRARLVDANKKQYTVTLSESINFTDWKYVKAAMPTGVAFPVSIDRIYVTALNTSATKESTIYFDSLAGIYNIVPKNTGASSITVTDSLKANIQGKNENGFDITVFGTTKGFTVPASLSAHMSKNSELQIYTGEINPEVKKQKANIVTWSNAYSINGYKDLVRIINLDATKGGLISTNARQWKNLTDDLYNTKAKYILITINKDILDSGSFTTKGESDLLHEALKKFALETGKKVFVLEGTKNTQNKVTTKDGIRYVQLGGLNVKEMKLLRLRVSDSGITYNLEDIK